MYSIASTFFVHFTIFQKPDESKLYLASSSSLRLSSFLHTSLLKIQGQDTNIQRELIL
jgi:hypothetical protein